MATKGSPTMRYEGDVNVTIASSAMTQTEANAVDWETLKAKLDIGKPFAIVLNGSALTLTQIIPNSTTSVTAVFGAEYAASAIDSDKAIKFVFSASGTLNTPLSGIYAKVSVAFE